MTVKLYLGKDYEHDQEKRAFRCLCSAGSHYLTGDAAIIGNIQFRGGQIDALVLGTRSITIVDFKDCGGTVTISENGVWQTGDRFRIAGGKGDVNPYQQVLRYKNALASELGASGLLPPPNDVRHISGLVMFTQEMAVDESAMGPAARKWFRAADVPGSMDFLRDRASPNLELSADRMDSIVSALEVGPFELLPSEKWVPMSTLVRAKQETHDTLRDLDHQRMVEWELENRVRLREEYAEACRGWAIHDALASLRRTLERQHPGTAFPEDVVAALRRAIAGGQPPLSAVLKAYQPLTSADLTIALQSFGVDPSEFT